MSLMQFLAVGKSFWNMEAPPNSYRLLRQNLLPKFSAETGEEAHAPVSVAHPVEAMAAARPRDDCSRVERDADEASALVGASPYSDEADPLAPADEYSGTEEGRAESSIAAVPANEAEVGESPAAAQTAASVRPAPSPVESPRRHWLVLKNPFTRKFVSKPLPGPAQGELSLDTLKVVRNDLSDADLEITPAAPIPVLVPAQTRLAAGSAKASAFLRRLRTRLFGAGRT